MKRLADWSLKTKLRFFTLLSVALALVFASMAFVVQDGDSVRDAKRRELGTLAELLSYNLVIPLQTKNSDNANLLLTSLHVLPAVEMAVIYDAYGYPFAMFPNGPMESAPFEPLSAPREAVFTPGHIEITQDIMQAGQRVGTIHLRSNMHELSQHFRHYLRIVSGVMIAALLAAVLLADQLQYMLTRSVQELASAIKKVSGTNDYSHRVVSRGQDELGVLCEGFNTMLDQIQHARNELQRANDELEQRVHDRTMALSQANEGLTSAIAEAQAANRAKSAFLANMSHEIRTPMTAIQGFADLLLDPGTPQKERTDHINTIRANSRHLLAIINDILDLSKIEAGKMTVETITASPAQIVAEVCSLMRARAQSKSLFLEAEFATAIPETIQTDPTRLRQIITNIIGNAIKFTERGGVRIVLSLEQAQSKQPKLAISIIDTGVGMSPDQLSRIFQAFTQADETMARRFGGTGLGLTISRRFAEMLGGEIVVTSEDGRGSTFRITVDTGPLEGVRLLEAEALILKPAARATLATSNVATKRAIQLTSRVLLVEDGTDNQRLISFVLKKAGATVEICENGLTGRDRALAARANGEPFDVILMDMQMPVLDGYAATSQLREAGYRGSIIALTAHAMNHDRQKCLDAGCDDYTTKPIDRQELLEKVAQWHTEKSGLSQDLPVVEPRQQIKPTVTA